MTIEAFSGEHFFLSNFAPAKVTLDGALYPTVEHAYQAAKTTEEAWRLAVLRQKTPRGAKSIGRLVPLRPEWEEIKLQVMRSLLVQKFARGTPYAFLLERTWPQELIEGNWWHDEFWGVCNGLGRNHLGRLLMEIRAELRE